MGPVGNADGGTEILIRDFDQTVIGNPAHDLVRLGVSLASAARGSNLPGATTARMVEEMVIGYRSAFAGGGRNRIERPAAATKVLRCALHRKWKDLARERIEDTSPEIPLGKRFWPLSAREREQLGLLLTNDVLRQVVASIDDGDSPLKVLDAAYWRKGCSSLGRLRYAVLVGRKGSHAAIVDVKEAVPAAAPKGARTKIPANHSHRVVTGASQLSPALGRRMAAGNLGRRPVFIRELLPQDLKLELECLKLGEATCVAGFLAYVVGRAHARQMDSRQRREWTKCLAINKAKAVKAPSWLWTSVVELLISHEKAYLEHCRLFAMSRVK
jgi:uncharacterized protein (DUF2252 family)